MKNKIIIAIFCLSALTVNGCTQAENVNYNISKEADNFNILRKLTVINCVTGDTLFQMSGRLSIKYDDHDNQLEILVEDDGRYLKHIVGLSKETTYVIEDLNTGANDVSKYRYTINFNPKMWIKNDFKYID